MQNYVKRGEAVFPLKAFFIDRLRQAVEMHFLEAKYDKAKNVSVTYSVVVWA